MKKIFFLLLLVSLSHQPRAFAKYPISEFELVVVETLPETMNLNMSLRQIEDAKHTSQLQKSKNSVYKVLTEKLNPLLSSQTFAKQYNLFELAKSIPTVAIVEDLIKNQMSTAGETTHPFQFMVLILPKVPDGSIENEKLPFASLYSSNKASVIDHPRLGLQPEKSFSENINDRIVDSIQFSFQNNYVNSKEKEAFFVGALLLINLEGEKTSLKVQLLGGLPTDLEYEVNLNQPEANFKYFRFPKTPSLRWFSEKYTDYPGVILTLEYKKIDENPLMLRMQFGSLSLIGENEIRSENTPQKYDDLWIGWKDLAGVLFKRYNVPHLYGSEFAPIGKVLITDLTRDIQVNIHDIDFNIETLEVTKMRVIVEFPPKTIWGGWNITHDFLPRVEQPALNEKFKEAINLQLKPYRDQLNTIKKEITQNGIAGVLANPEINSEIIEIINKMLENKSGDNQ